MELGRYGATVNALCPTALTPMTEAVGLGDTDDARAGALDPSWVSPALVWLASPLSQRRDRPRRSSRRASGWPSPRAGTGGPTGPPVADAADVDAVIRPLLAAAAPNADVQGDIAP